MNDRRLRPRDVRAQADEEVARIEKMTRAMKLMGRTIQNETRKLVDEDLAKEKWRKEKESYTGGLQNLRLQETQADDSIKKLRSAEDQLERPTMSDDDRKTKEKLEGELKQLKTDLADGHRLRSNELQELNNAQRNKHRKNDLPHLNRKVEQRNSSIRRLQDAVAKKELELKSMNDAYASKLKAYDDSKNAIKKQIADIATKLTKLKKDLEKKRGDLISDASRLNEPGLIIEARRLEKP